MLGADPNAEAAARELEGEARAGKPVDPALAAASVNVVAVHGAAEDYRRFAEMADHAPTPQEQLRYLYGLPLFRGADEMTRTLAAALDGGIRTQNAPFVLAFATLNREQGELAWDFLRSRWDELNAKLPSGLVIRMVEGEYLPTFPAGGGGKAQPSSPHRRRSRSRAEAWIRCSSASA